MDTSVTVTQKRDGSYEVKIGTKTITLPANSITKNVEDENGVNYGIEYGVPGKSSIKLIQGGDVIVVENGEEEKIAEEADGLDISENLALAWGDPEKEGGRRRSRLNRKAQRTKRNGRKLKRSKLRKLTTRRR